MLTSPKFCLNYTSLPSFFLHFYKNCGYPLIMCFLKRYLCQKCIIRLLKNLFLLLLISNLILSMKVLLLNFSKTFIGELFLHSKVLLWELRTNLPMFHVLIKLEDHLHIPIKESEGFIRFLCPFCNEMQATINPSNNLSHCFVCGKNLNNIDLLIANGYTFSLSVEILKDVWAEFKKRSQIEAPPSTWQ